LDIAYDRQRISKLETPKKEPGKTEISRAEKIEKYLSSRPDHRAIFETLKGHLGKGNDLLNKTIKSLYYHVLRYLDLAFPDQLLKDRIQEGISHPYRRPQSAPLHLAATIG
jgi:hypothetical protein